MLISRSCTTHAILLESWRRTSKTHIQKTSAQNRFALDCGDCVYAEYNAAYVTLNGDISKQKEKSEVIYDDILAHYRGNCKRRKESSFVYKGEDSPWQCPLLITNPAYNHSKEFITPNADDIKRFRQTLTIRVSNNNSHAFIHILLLSFCVYCAYKCVHMVATKCGLVKNVKNMTSFKSYRVANVVNTTLVLELSNFDTVFHIPVHTFSPLPPATFTGVSYVPALHLQVKKHIIHPKLIVNWWFVKLQVAGKTYTDQLPLAIPISPLHQSHLNKFLKQEQFNVHLLLGSGYLFEPLPLAPELAQNNLYPSCTAPTPPYRARSSPPQCTA